MRNQKKTFKTIRFIFAVFLSFFVLLASCVFTFLKAYSYQDRREEAANANLVSSSVSSSSPSAVTSGNSSGTATSVAESVSVTDADLILVNYNHKLPDGYQPDLVTAYEVQIDRQAAEAYEKMNTAAASDGVSLWISSAYLDEESLTQQYKQEVRSSQFGSQPEGSGADAVQSSSRPGYSEYSTGLVLDFNGKRDDFDTMPAFRWLNQHAQDYGFILRYPEDKQSITKIKYEPWHYRYVGVQNAKIMKEKNLCLEEYIDLLQKK